MADRPGPGDTAGVTAVPTVELAEVARLSEGDVDPSTTLARIVAVAVSLVPGCSGAGLTVLTADAEGSAVTTDERVARCHAVQFHDHGEGPAREAMRFGEPRRSEDLEEESRWPAFTRTAVGVGFRSCLALPLPSDRTGTSALVLYADEPGTFAGTSFDVALLFAAQGGVALDNAELYRSSHEMVTHLHRALTTRSLIERAKGVLMGVHGISSQAAFELLRRESQTSHRKLTEVAREVLDRQHPGPDPAEDVPWTPPRAPESCDPGADG